MHAMQHVNIVFFMIAPLEMQAHVLSRPVTQ
jgi:hypothetical protein